jgi:hypothetical protein
MLRLPLQANLIALARGGHDQFPTALLYRALRLLNHRRDFFVGVVGIVMEESETFCTGAQGELDGVIGAGVAPATAGGIFDRIVL